MFCIEPQIYGKAELEFMKDSEETTKLCFVDEEMRKLVTFRLIGSGLCVCVTFRLPEQRTVSFGFRSGAAKTREGEFFQALCKRLRATQMSTLFLDLL